MLNIWYYYGKYEDVLTFTTEKFDIQFRTLKLERTWKYFLDWASIVPEKIIFCAVFSMKCSKIEKVPTKQYYK